MSQSDDIADLDLGSLPRRAAKRLLRTANELVELARNSAIGARSRAMADVLVLDSQLSFVTELHRRFTMRASEGDGGLDRALEALDLIWENVRALRSGATAMLHTLSSDEELVRDHRSRFYLESTALLEEGIREVFSGDLGALALPPERMAVLVRVAMEGLVVELAQAKTPEEVAVVDQAYADLRTLFARYVLHAEGDAIEEVRMEPIPLPW